MNNHLISLDFDGTLRVDNMEKECIEFLEAIPDNVISVINTGRGISILQEKIKHYFPEHFDLFMNKLTYFICNNGTDIYYKDGDEFKTLQEWSDHLKDQWDVELLMERLTPLAEKLEFDLYPESYNFKLLYYFHKVTFDIANKDAEEFRSAIADLEVKLVHAQSSQVPPPGLMKFVCEIFPEKAGKGNALIFLKDYLDKQNQNVDSIACFGDDRNDLQTIVDMPLLYDWWYGCLVGNSTDWILERAEKAMPDLKGDIIVAPKEYPGPLGIVWIMKKLGWM